MLAHRHRFITGAAAWIKVLSFFGGMLLITLIDLLVPSHENPYDARSLEGICVSIPIYFATGSKKKALWLSFLSGVSEPAGALIGYLLILQFFSTTIFEILFASVAGIMVFISMDELFSTAKQCGERHAAVYRLISGMAMMALRLLLFM